MILTSVSFSIMVSTSLQKMLGSSRILTATISFFLVILTIYPMIWAHRKTQFTHQDGSFAYELQKNIIITKCLLELLQAWETESRNLLVSSRWWGTACLFLGSSTRLSRRILGIFLKDFSAIVISVTADWTASMLDRKWVSFLSTWGKIKII